MSTIDNAGVEHKTRTYSYEDSAAPYGITTWWAWECTCGETDTGIDEVFAQDLANTHESRMTACTCGNPTIARTHSTGMGTPWTGYTVTCDCGYKNPVRLGYFSNGRNGNVAHIRKSAYAVALSRYLDHQCRRLTGHTHVRPEPVLVTA